MFTHEQVKFDFIRRAPGIGSSRSSPVLWRKNPTNIRFELPTFYSELRFSAFLSKIYTDAIHG
jgi:hypothetical protein